MNLNVIGFSVNDNYELETIDTILFCITIIISENWRQIMNFMSIWFYFKLFLFSPKIIDLLNQASLYGRTSIRVQHLRHVQELVLRKDPSLLQYFLEVY